MAIQETLANAVFAKAWRLLDSPTMIVIPPIGTWTLPAGVVYDGHYDAFVDSLDNKITLDWAAWSADVTTRLPYLPGRRIRQVSMQLPGVVSTDLLDVVIVMWSQVAEDAVGKAWGIALGNFLYRVREWTVTPVGIARPVWIEIRLSEGG